MQSLRRQIYNKVCKFHLSIINLKDRKTDVLHFKKNLYFCRLKISVMWEEKKFNISNLFRNFNWKKRLIMFAVVVALAVVYIFVFSDSNYRIHKKLNNKIAEQEQELEKQKQNVAAQSTYKNMRNDSLDLERYRREQLNMKKENEDLFLIKE